MKNKLEYELTEREWKTAACMAASIAAAAGTGAVLMYFFDPDRGKARRRLVQDQATSKARHARQAMQGTYVDLANRAQGLKAELDARLHPEPVSDVKLAERVRAKLGRLTTHPHAIHVDAQEGRVVLTGHVLVDEVDRILLATRFLPGVKGVENRMAMYESAEGVAEFGFLPSPEEAPATS